MSVIHVKCGLLHYSFNCAFPGTNLIQRVTANVGIAVSLVFRSELKEKYCMSQNMNFFNEMTSPGAGGEVE